MPKYKGVIIEESLDDLEILYQGRQEAIDYGLSVGIPAPRWILRIAMADRTIFGAKTNQLSYDW